MFELEKKVLQNLTLNEIHNASAHEMCHWKDYENKQQTKK